MNIMTIEWKDNKIKIIDQTKLPEKLEYVYIKDLKALWRAIRELKVRGAPALGAAAGLGVYMGIRGSRVKNFAQLKKELDRVISYIGSSRPTARNLFWGLERMRNTALMNKEKSLPSIKKAIFREAQKIIQEDRIACRKIGYYGAKLIGKNESILTICNTGALATIDYGTALGVVYRACEEGRLVEVFVCETRPLLQGARLTTWELRRHNIDATLICDSAAAALIRRKKIDKVIVGADRIAANGDSANKIGTYNLAVLSRHHKIPFYIAAPLSTFDATIKTGEGIPIEERPAREVTELFFKSPIAAKGIKVFNPAFDVTPHDLITAFVTEKGIIKPPYKKNIRETLKV